MRGRNNNNNSGGGNNTSNNNNRKGPNPLTRNYESNGPDVKIRGSAQQVAEKYATLARDAHSAGDRVMAENYLQHAEHYNRIIAAAQAQFSQQQPQQFSRDDDDDMDDDRDDMDGQQQSDFNAPQQHQPQHQQPISLGAGPQPVIEGTPAEVALTQGDRADQPRRQNGHPNGELGEDGQPRRSRRPRRGRNRPDFAAGGTEANGDDDGGQPQQAAPIVQSDGEGPADAPEPVAVGQD